MAKSSKRKRNNPISINSIYEAIKERNFAQELWMDVISDIEDKPTYIRIKEMVKRVVNEKLGKLDLQPVDDAERMQRRGTFAEISIMAYTVDRVISEFLYRRLQNEFKSIVGNMLKELQTEKKVPKDSNTSKVDSVFENIESIFTGADQSSIAEGGNVISPPAEVNKTPARKRGRPKKVVPTEISDKSLKEKDSDADSIASLGSISSVHTTDLSSFDDNISICTDEGENGHKMIQLPLQKVNTMLKDGELPSIYKLEKSPNAAQDKKSKRKYQESLANPKHKVSRKVRPRRSRKPNKKYNAETMYCQVKDYSSRQTNSPSSTDDSDSPKESESDEEEPKEKKHTQKKAKVQKVQKEILSPVKTVLTRSLRNGSSSNDGVAQKIPPPSSSSTPTKSSAQRYSSADLYKPRFHFGNRNASAFTIFT